MNYRKEMKYAFEKSIPIFVSYFFVAIAFGLLMQQGGFSWIWSLASSLFIYTGAFQFVLASFLSAGASVLTIFLTCAFMSTRQIFYGLSYVDDFKKTGKFLPYMIHSLTDETYALYNSITEYPEHLSKEKIQLFIGIFSQTGWCLGSVAGGLVGNLVPASLGGIDFALTALFITIVVDQWRNASDHLPAVIGFVSALFFLLILGADNFLLPSLITTSGLLIFSSTRKEASHG